MVNVIKASGEKAPFVSSKLLASLKRAGASESLAQNILREMEALLYEGITTKKIYKEAFARLRKSSKPMAAKYKLKAAIMELGPTGYPFEKFVGEILHYQGFDVKVGVIVQGHCVQHEIDVVAEKASDHYMVECKFHSDQARHCDVKVPLYIHSRFRDVEKQWKKHEAHSTKFHQGWIFTNTRFTDDAIKYGSCAGLMLVGWNYPRKGGLKDFIDKLGLHPVTSLTTLTKYEKQTLLSGNHVLCRDICDNPKLLSKIGVKTGRQKGVLEEARALCDQ
ncbi:restriction endonuclease [Fulvivirga sp. 29W222]|uniref:Restriction endonuclease n=1 Tax=Fulvivirga marina TaxID=2494733 RepID=A0A937KF06_9BACT|nr:restriction endonuclease [Fulvivirga marina]MBL6447708.1 restriction endonuclease [Fulvivirga marina]